MTVGIVAVSHSLPLAEAALELALQMIPGEKPPVAVAAGTQDGGFGTDAVAVADAITAVDQGDGVIVLVDLGSAVLSAEMALEFLPDPDAQVQVIAAPFVEGLLAATVRAATGGTFTQVAQEAATALQPKVEQLGGCTQTVSSADGVQSSAAASAAADAASAVAESAVAMAENSATAEGVFAQQVVLINPMGLHARPAGQIAQMAAQFSADIRLLAESGKTASAHSPLAVAALATKGGQSVTVQAQGADAQAAVQAMSELIASGFGEAPQHSEQPQLLHTSDAIEHQPAALLNSDPAAVSAQMRPQKPLGVSPGRVVAQVLRMSEPLTEPVAAAPLNHAQRDSAILQLKSAVQDVAAQLQAQAQATKGNGSEILAATAQLVQDPLIVAESSKLITEQGLTPAKAVWQVLDEVAHQYTAAGGALAERASDVRGVRDRLVAHLTGQQLPQVPVSDTPFILVARDLTPADTAQLDPRSCIGLVVAEGGPTSHTAILARAYGIAAVIAPVEFAQLQAGDTVLLDGGSGEIIVNPDVSVRKTARAVPQLLEDLPPLQAGGVLASGEPVQLLANVGGAKDVAHAVERGAEGVGLFRTEFCFLGRQQAPTLAEQIAAYTPVFKAFSGKKVVVRTLDAGSDKPLPFVTAAAEQNPALGVRGLRTSWAHPEILTTQLQAIAQAAENAGAQPWVMAPMVATVAEATEFVATCRAAGLSKQSGARIGVMVETPAAALLAQELFAHIDFVSLGTNDLAQYTMAADRMTTELAHLNSAWQPAVLRMIRQVGVGAAGAPVGVCGEAAADPLLAAVFVGLGVNSLSMTASALPLVGKQLAQVSLAQCQNAAAAACAADSATVARASAAEILHG